MYKQDGSNGFCRSPVDIVCSLASDESKGSEFVSKAELATLLDKVGYKEKTIALVKGIDMETLLHRSSAS